MKYIKSIVLSSLLMGSIVEGSSKGLNLFQKKFVDQLQALMIQVSYYIQLNTDIIRYQLDNQDGPGYTVHPPVKYYDSLPPKFPPYTGHRLGNEGRTTLSSQNKQLFKNTNLENLKPITPELKKINNQALQNQNVQNRRLKYFELDIPYKRSRDAVTTDIQGNLVYIKHNYTDNKESSIGSLLDRIAK